MSCLLHHLCVIPNLGYTQLIFFRKPILTLLFFFSHTFDSTSAKSTKSGIFAFLFHLCKVAITCGYTPKLFHVVRITILYRQGYSFFYISSVIQWESLFLVVNFGFWVFKDRIFHSSWEWATEFFGFIGSMLEKLHWRLLFVRPKQGNGFIIFE